MSFFLHGEIWWFFFVFFVASKKKASLKIYLKLMFLKKKKHTIELIHDFKRYWEAGTIFPIRNRICHIMFPTVALFALDNCHILRFCIFFSLLEWLLFSYLIFTSYKSIFIYKLKKNNNTLSTHRIYFNSTTTKNKTKSINKHVWFI